MKICFEIGMAVEEGVSCRQLRLHLYQQRHERMLESDLVVDLVLEARSE